MFGLTVRVSAKLLRLFKIGLVVFQLNRDNLMLRKS